MNNLSLAMRSFNDKVKLMNQSNSRQLVLSADEARALHSDLFNVLATLTNVQNPKESEITQIQFDGGSFK